MLKIVGLVENTTESPNLKYKHGLSLYIETERHRILFDMGPNDLFLENARKLGVDIASIDIAVISHGHVDHCGGLKSFLKGNSTARIYTPTGFGKTLCQGFGHSILCRDRQNARFRRQIRLY